MMTDTAIFDRDVAREYAAINALPASAARQIGAVITRWVAGARLLDTTPCYRRDVVMS